MFRKLISYLDRIRQGRNLRRWGAAAEAAPHMHLSKLRPLRTHARQIRRQIDRLLHVADERLALPLTRPRSIPQPMNSDWAWRPELWCGPVWPSGVAAVENRTMLGSQITVFHDCKDSGITLRQIRNLSDEEAAPFGLAMDVLDFDGAFLSLVIPLPDSAVEGLRQRHLIRIHAAIETERPLEIFFRLNIKHGPNTEDLLRHLPLEGAEPTVEFDLAYSKMNEKRVERAWIDMIFEGPRMNRIALRDLTFTRRPRAEI